MSVQITPTVQNPKGLETRAHVETLGVIARMFRLRQMFKNPKGLGNCQ